MISQKKFNVINNFKISEGELLNKLYNNTNFSDNSLNSFSSKDKDRMSLRFKIIEEFKKKLIHNYMSKVLLYYLL